MKFFGHFMIREDGDLNDKYLELSATSKTAAVKQSREIAKKNGWRYFGIHTEAIPAV